ncbi:MAG: gamma-glutamyl-gamma-aminobutyrate hydrolase family protein, partial [Planctomycetes bacterium]|nr:gamma-glutamyl-gamma-aminobutyrate hydrolase family protein [Planctomycetota bacterium]
GATLLAASDAESEEKETEIKAEAFIKAVRDGNKVVVKEEYKPTSGVGKKVLFVDHQDSFVHTLGGYVRQTGAEVLTMRSGFPESLIDEFKPDLVFLSPGPFTPSHFGLPELIKRLMARNIPLFGVCLGLQGMVEAMGGELGVLDIPQHGVHAYIKHNNTCVFEGLPQPMKASRYHSLYGIEEKLPGCFNISARSEDGVIMGITHKSYPMAAVQFHPESIHALGKDAGLRLIDNVLRKFCL